jgi:hypothetical protein
MNHIFDFIILGPIMSLIFGENAAANAEKSKAKTFESGN